MQNDRGPRLAGPTRLGSPVGGCCANLLCIGEPIVRVRRAPAHWGEDCDIHSAIAARRYRHLDGGSALDLEVGDECPTNVDDLGCSETGATDGDVCAAWQVVPTPG